MRSRTSFRAASKGGGCLPNAWCEFPCSCSSAPSACSVKEEFYRVFGSSADANEVFDVCFWMGNDEKNMLRCLMSDKTGN